MPDRAGQVWALVGGLLLGLTANAVVGLISPGSLGWFALGTGVVGAYPAIASVAGWWLPGRRPRREDVVQSAYALCAAIETWLTDRARDSPDLDSYNGTLLDWHARERISDAYSRETMARWNDRFHLRTVAVFDALLREGATADERDRFHLENVVNPLGIGFAARLLARMAAQLDRTGA